MKVFSTSIGVKNLCFRKFRTSFENPRNSIDLLQGYNLRNNIFAYLIIINRSIFEFRKRDSNPKEFSKILKKN